MPYQAIKTYTAEVGLSCCFRQWKAESHCRFLHGYALSFSFAFQAEELDRQGWVINFGGLKLLKDALALTFDHKLIVAQDDPELPLLLSLSQAKVANLFVMEGVGCEAFARYALSLATSVLRDLGEADRVHVAHVECSEHRGNAARYIS